MLICIIFVVMILLSLLWFFVIPYFVEPLESMNITLPLPTKPLMAMMLLVKNYWEIFAGILILIGFGLTIVLRARKGKKADLDD